MLVSILQNILNIFVVSKISVILWDRSVFFKEYSENRKQVSIISRIMRHLKNISTDYICQRYKVMKNNFEKANE